ARAGMSNLDYANVQAERDARERAERNGTNSSARVGSAPDASNGGAAKANKPWREAGGEYIDYNAEFWAEQAENGRRLSKREKAAINERGRFPADEAELKEWLRPKIKRQALAEIIAEHPELHPPVVDGLVREGET